MRLGVYVDLLYHFDGATVSTDEAFVEFALSMAGQVDELVLLGRLSASPDPAPYRLPTARVRFVPLPAYPRTSDLLKVLRVLPRSAKAFARETPNLDAVWLFGPHPLSLIFAALARRRGVDVYLGVRQDFPRYIGGRLPSRRWLWALPIAHAFEWAFRVASRRYPTVVAGDELARRYGAGRRPLTGVISLVRATDLATLSQTEGAPWGEGEIRVLSVGRLDPEKNPLLLADVLARLRERDRRWRFVVVGDGPLESALVERARELGVADALELRGYVPNGPELFRCYRSSHLLLHVSSTEGLPQVLLEAQAARLPIVGTDVGGVASALGHGQAGVLVPPADAPAAADALELLAADPALRSEVVAAGLEHVRSHTLEAEVARVAAYFGLEPAAADRRGATRAGEDGTGPSETDRGRGLENPDDILLHPEPAQPPVSE